MLHRRSSRISIKPLVLEAFFVVLGVVLALGLNEWREHRHDQAEAAFALESIRAELAANRASVETAYAYHASLLDTLRGLRQPPDMRLFNQGFVAPGQVLTTAWDAASATGVLAHMDYGDVLTVAQAYATQARYQEQARRAGRVIYEKLLDEGTQGLVDDYQKLPAIIATFWWQEQELMESYDDALAELGRSDAPPASSPITAPP